MFTDKTSTDDFHFVLVKTVIRYDIIFFLHLQQLGSLLWDAVYFVTEFHQMESSTLMFHARKVWQISKTSKTNS